MAGGRDEWNGVTCVGFSGSCEQHAHAPDGVRRDQRAAYYIDERAAPGRTAMEVARH
jgi:hypothetical protein